MPSDHPKTHTTEPMSASRCPFMEYEKIMEKNPVLAPTGCTDKFCQAGRMVHTHEPKVGENRPLDIVREEASGFLWQLWQDDIYTESQYNERRAQVTLEIERSAKEKIVWNQGIKRVGKTSSWTQTREELRYGLRLAWRNSRKCIMRSRYQELDLCDLRHIHTSVGMVTTLLDAVTKAFNRGQITPTVFVFPPKSVDGNGPMFWNQQVLNFAAVSSPCFNPSKPEVTDSTQYELDDGSILGDPSNVQLTKDIIDLGWAPPSPKGRWDLLPLVAMAEDDAPALVELPDHLRRLISIEHPDYPGIGQLDLKWYQFPALSRLGFDIGGVQYMDAEIGVRNLADTFRFDSLPDVAKAVGFNVDSYRKRPEYANIRVMEDLPDYEQLRWLSRAQAELNYAVRWSFLQKGVTCVGTLAASSDWCHFDDDHAAKNGYRMNSDPYWLSPPQGSIVPVWHRGGAPNYQPKPMICRNRYDPVKSWHRQKSAIEADPVRLVRKEDRWVIEVLSSLNSDLSQFNGNGTPAPQSKGPSTTVHICYCSKGTTARILADKLHGSVKKCAKTFRVTFGTLNALDLQKVDPSDVILVVTSTTGSGTFPSNGEDFAKLMGHRRKTLTTDFSQLRVSVFGVGDSAYPNFNAAAIDVYKFFNELGVAPIAGGLIKSDVASEALPLRLFYRWLDVVESSLAGGISELRENLEDEFIAQTQMLRKFDHATLLSISSSPTARRDESLILMTLGGIESAEMTHLRLLPTNSLSQVSRALIALGIEDAQKQIPFSDKTLRHLSYQDFLSSSFEHSPISLFAGFRPVDADLIRATTSLAEKHGVLDISCLVPSNAEKRRVQDFLYDSRDTIREKLVKQGGYVYVCGSAIMTEGVRSKLAEIVGEDLKESLGDRYVEEVF
ncbi:nitric-oxide synthase [Aspergillus ellipticus CBS 707.79]|uniref:nitric-oxide synthase (NADPH) n=1 Tax=Aspergillus ellipticus CBS 707.79 TaxID=1448320 RepID=A0A319CZY9_9EURO|nr:nitric-oxide synthase [Aspergillus ellipticus CBS 707.79]